MKRAILSLAHSLADRRRGGLSDDITILLNGQLLNFFDIGAAGGLQPRWQPIAANLAVVAFEPDERSSVMLAEKLAVCGSVDIRKVGLWSKAGDLSFNLCRSPQVSSHFEPNRELMDRFPAAERLDVLQTVTLPAITLDSLGPLPCDAMKLDIQGGEYDVLLGARETLEKTFAVESEVEFVEIYRGQPLFGDISKYLAELSLEFNDFIYLTREDRRWGELNPGMCTFADALFLRSPESIAKQYLDERIGIEVVRRYAAVLRVYERFDCLAALSNMLTERGADAQDLCEQMTGIVSYNAAVWRRRRRSFRLVNLIAQSGGRDLRLFPTY